MPLHMRRSGFEPISALTEVREAEGITTVTTSLGESAHLITRYEDVRAVLSDTERFSNVRTTTPERQADLTDEEIAESRAGNLLGYDPPEHTRLRRMLTPEFTVRRMRRLEPRIAEIVDSALDDLVAAGRPADLVEHFALPVPSLVICELLGVPYGDRGEFQGLSNQLLDLSLAQSERLGAQTRLREMTGIASVKAAVEE